MSSVSTFTGLERVEGSRKRYGYRDPFFWDVGRKGSGMTLRVPPRTEFDFDVSVPRWLEWAQSPHETPVVIASGVHDWLLEDGHDAAFASSEFRRVLRAFGVSAQRAWRLYFATLFFTAFR